MLIEAALGKQFETLRDKYMEKPQPGTDSTFAKGSMHPNPKEALKLDDDKVHVPCGKQVSSGVNGSSFMHNEKVIYRKEQCRIRYLLMCKSK